jgi:hypothetical protein
MKQGCVVDDEESIAQGKGDEHCTRNSGDSPNLGHGPVFLLA